mmetsp:Transcript_3925/g.6179  ORF Transcript_3925/g.6179 Transcript_3925/m.6179 type:complete len:276 (+) Transcript_3925:88-915(+)|eukprot:CAMPEP_0178740638 /NCGR_PEP_ID=MMETSP0744-20121128/4701_1 /TAXON_ID=913974 /ORGANISM="Nitzschia punctata, Strain CCMP561" /LENGTH=275 /DNA_ID=CAMNT_0020393433 /DNA_START=48 /DNA_END=875 /DNA_ORIENTATION=-
MANRTYYEVLEVETSATANEIRKQYLKKSLLYHPDKNPDNPEEAKRKFVEIGAAYETLSDPEKRRMYDQELRRGRASSSTSTNNSRTSHAFSTTFNTDQAYDNYRDAFDATVAGMSEDELAAAVGTVAAVAGVIGSLIGSRVLNGGGRNCGRSTGGNVLGLAGSMIGSMVASEMAASSVRAIHQESVQRVAYREACRRAVERGEPMPDAPQSNNILQKTFDTVINATQSAVGNNNHSNGHRNDGTDGQNRFSGMWKKAAEGVKAAARNSNARGQS